MSAGDATGAIDHEEALRLLPWLVNGTLASEERERVERHVHDCLACRSELREQVALRELVQRQPDVYTSVEQGFAALARQLDSGSADAQAPRLTPVAGRRVSPAPAERTRPGEAWNGLDRLVRGWRLIAPPYGARGLAFASAAALAVAVLLWMGLRAPDGDVPAYRTLSAQRSSSAARLDIVFSPGATQQDVRDVLAEIGATIVGGPSAVGRYTVELDRPEASDADVDALARTLLEDRRVKFAGRSYIDVPGEDGENPKRAGGPR